MKRRKNIRKIINNEYAVSEEFTTLPSITVVMVGLTLFILLVSNTYSSYEHRVESLQKYQTANFIATKLTNPDCPFIQAGGSVHYDKYLQFQDSDEWAILQQDYNQAGIGFKLRLSFEDTTQTYHTITINPLQENFDITTIGDRVAVSREVSIQLNDVLIVMGQLTIITWSV